MRVRTGFPHQQPRTDRSGRIPIGRHAGPLRPSLLATGPSSARRSKAPPAQARFVLLLLRRLGLLLRLGLPLLRLGPLDQPDLVGDAALRAVVRRQLGVVLRLGRWWGRRGGWCRELLRKRGVLRSLRLRGLNAGRCCTRRRLARGSGPPACGSPPLSPGLPPPWWAPRPRPAPLLQAGPRAGRPVRDRRDARLNCSWSS